MLDNIKQRHAFHGLYRSLVNNMVIGVSEGYKKELELLREDWGLKYGAEVDALEEKIRALQ